MSTYHNRETGQPVDAIQYTDQLSAILMEKQFKCSVVYVKTTYHSGYLIVDGVRVLHGQYAVRSMCSIVAIDQEIFDERFKIDEYQMELFNEL